MRAFNKQGIGEYFALQKVVQHLVGALASSSKEGRRIVALLEEECFGTVAMAEKEYVEGKIDEETLRGIKVGIGRLLDRPDIV